jgi:hypothetical protein
MTATVGTAVSGVIVGVLYSGCASATRPIGSSVVLAALVEFERASANVFTRA